jgi:hypothetical protein
MGFFVSLIVALLLTIFVNYQVDPLGIWGNNTDGFYYENERELKYGLAKNNSYDGIIFGSSKVGYIPVSHLTEIKILNAAWDNAVIEEIYYFIRDVQPETGFIFIGLDLYMFNESYAFRNESEFDYDFLEKMVFLVSSDVLRKSLRTYFAKDEDPLFLSNGEKNEWSNMINDIPIKERRHIGLRDFLVNSRYRDFKLSDKRLKILLEIKKYCDQNHIKLLYWLNPYNKIGLDVIEDLELIKYFTVIQDFLDKNNVAYINFNDTEYSYRTDDNYWSFDFIHYYPKVGLMMLKDHLLKKK